MLNTLFNTLALLHNFITRHTFSGTQINAEKHRFSWVFGAKRYESGQISVSLCAAPAYRGRREGRGFENASGNCSGYFFSD